MNSPAPDFDNSASGKQGDEAPHPYQHIDVEYNPANRMLWTYLRPLGTQCFNPALLEELHHNDTEFQKNGGRYLFEGDLCQVDYYVVASRNPRIFSLGGDLALFIMLIKARDREGLVQYAKRCIDCIYPRAINYDTPAVTISLIQGDAFGGGFETALSSNLIVAERHVRMGFPEIIFNLFPGMGAYSLLARKVGAKMAEDLVSKGNIYTAEELYKMGVVDVLAPEGEGDRALHDLVRQHGRHLNGLRAIYQCRRHVNPVSYQELLDIAMLWVDAAMRINDRDLQMMSRLVRSHMRMQDLPATHASPENEDSRGAELAAA